MAVGGEGRERVKRVERVDGAVRRGHRTGAVGRVDRQAGVDGRPDVSEGAAAHAGHAGEAGAHGGLQRRQRAEVVHLRRNVVQVDAAVVGGVERHALVVHRRHRRRHVGTLDELRHHRRLTRLAVSHEHRHGDATGRRQRRHVEPLLLTRLLQLVAVVLEPDLNLRRRQAQDARQVFALRRRQVALLSEALLQLVGLRLREEHASLLLLRRALQRAGGGLQRQRVTGAVAGGAVALRVGVADRLAAQPTGRGVEVGSAEADDGLHVGAAVSRVGRHVAHQRDGRGGVEGETRQRCNTRTRSAQWAQRNTA